MIKTALIVEDSLVEIKNLGQILSDMGLRVYTANTGNEGLEAAHKHRPDVIFLDIVMPEMDGYEACRKFAGDPATKNIPVIFVSTKNQEADKVWAEMLGSKGYITKPYSEQEIVDSIKKLN